VPAGIPFTEDKEVPAGIPFTEDKEVPAGIPFTEDKEVYFVRALYQGKARCAWWMAQRLDAARVWELLEWYCGTIITESCRSIYQTCLLALQGYEDLLGYRSEEYDVVVRCAAVLMMCLTPHQQTESVRLMIAALDSRVVEKVAEWNALYGRRAGRVYSLPTGCLYGTTWRGQSKWTQHNRAQLHHIEPQLLGCPFWDEAIAEYGVVVHGCIQWRSAEDMEAFYDRFFPDDIPDEWTQEEKCKSHGDGILGPMQTVSLRVYAARFLSLPSRLTWGCLRSVQMILQKWKDKEECHPSSIICAYVEGGQGQGQGQDRPLSDEWLRPVRKIKHAAR
jgi:hypothetical protein